MLKILKKCITSRLAISGEMKEQLMAKVKSFNTLKYKVVIVIISAILLTSVVLGICLMRKMNQLGNFRTLTIWLLVGLLVVVFVSFFVILLTCMVVGLRRKMTSNQDKKDEVSYKDVTTDEVSHEKDAVPRSQIMPATKLKNAAAEERSKNKSRRIKLYRNVIENETYRMMRSIDIVVSEAMDLFGPERTQIFFDLLAAKSFNFGSAGAIAEFVPNMAESAVRQNILSFFEYSHEMMNQLKKVLLSCPNSKQLQQMPEQNFISLIQLFIESLPETKTKGRKRLSSKGNTFIMVDPEEFELELGEEIPEDFLDRLRRRDEMVVHSFVVARLERTQASDRRDNRPIHSIYFPSDCRLFIYIPTEKGSYWHNLDMQRASRLSQHRK